MASQADIIKSYLVSLGFSIDSASYAKFQGAMRTLSSTVEQATKGMAKQYGLMAVEVVGAIGSISLATVGLMDKVARADMGYQKFALNMYMTKDAAKNLKIVTDAMGQSLDDIRHIPELEARFYRLMDLSRSMDASKGAGHEGIFEEIRNMQEAFVGLKIVATRAFEYIAVAAFKFLQGPFAKTKMSLNEMVTWLAKNIDKWTQPIGEFLGKVTMLSVKMWEVLKELWNKLKEIDIAGIWKELIKLGGELKTTIKDIQKSFAIMFDESNVERKFVSLNEVVKALVFTLIAGVHAIALMVDSVAGMAAYGMLIKEGKWDEGEDLLLEIAARQDRRFKLIEDLKVDARLKDLVAGKPDTGGKLGGKPAPLDKEIAESAERNKINPNLLKAIVNSESNYNPKATSETGVIGAAQVTVDTSKRFLKPEDGPLDRMNAKQSIELGARYLAWLLDHFNGDVAKTISAYSAGEGYKGIPSNSPKPDVNMAYTRRTLDKYAEFNAANSLPPVSAAGISTPSAGLSKRRPPAKSSKKESSWWDIVFPGGTDFTGEGRRASAPGYYDPTEKETQYIEKKLQYWKQDFLDMWGFGDKKETKASGNTTKVGPVSITVVTPDPTASGRAIKNVIEGWEQINLGDPSYSGGAFQ